MLPLAVLIGAAAGCSSSTASSSPGPTPTSAQHLYVANGNVPGGIAQFTLPLTTASAPNFTLPNSGANGFSGVAAGPGGNLAAMIFPPQTDGPQSTVSIYEAPLSAASQPSASFGAPQTSSQYEQLAFSSSGDLWAVTGAQSASRYTQPFRASTSAQTTVTIPAGAANGVALDSSGNLYVASDLHAGSEIYVYAPPYTGQPIVIPKYGSAEGTGEFRRLTAGASQLFVGTLDGVLVYALPITGTSTPSFTLSAGGSAGGVALDSKGNLYVAGITSVMVYAPPFSASSQPVLTLPITSTGFITGISVGN